MNILNKISNSSNLFKLLLFSWLYLLLIIPSLEIISSAPADFKDIWKIMGILLYIFIFSNIVFLFIFSKINPKRQKIFIIIMMFMLSYFLSNYYFFSGKYGLMDYFVFHDDNVFDTSLFAILKDIFVIIILILILILFLIIIPQNIMKNIIIFILLAFLVSSIKFIYLINTDKQIATKVIEKQKKPKEIHNLKKEIIFSRNNQNVLIIFLDRFMGGFIPDILKDNPELKKELNGFVWYPNSLSVATGTAVGLAPIYGGYKFADVDFLLKSNYKWSFRIHDTKQMKDRYETSTKFMLEKFYNKGYDTTIFDPNFLSDTQLKKISKNTFKFKRIRERKEYLNTFYYPYELNKNNHSKKPFNMIKEYMLPFSIFKVISPSLRKEIYNNGVWFAGLSSVAVNHIDVIREISYSRAWRHISEIKDNIGGSFNFITSNLTHHVPINRNMNNTFQGVIPKYSSSDEKRFKDKYSASHYYLALEALKQSSLWFKWLKDNNIYNNTKIIITADHGATAAFNPMFKTQRNENGVKYGGYHINLMVKDFNKIGNLEINNSFMTNSDTPYLALSAIDKQAHKKYGSNKNKGFRLYTNNKDKGSLTVFDNIFETKNWVYKTK